MRSKKKKTENRSHEAAKNSNGNAVGEKDSIARESILIHSTSSRKRNASEHKSSKLPKSPQKSFRSAKSSQKPAQTPAQQLMSASMSRQSPKAVSQSSPWKKQSTLSKAKTLRQKEPQDSSSKNSSKKVLLAYENKASSMAQLWDMLGKHFKHLFGFSSCSLVAMTAFPIFACLSYFYVGQVAKTMFYPDFNLSKLKHPLYQTTYLDPETDTFDSTFDTNYRQQAEFEEFFQFMNYTNVDRETGKDENGEPITVRSYQPSTDLTGPGSWLPSQCYSTADYKYASTVIAYIKNGNRLEQDLLKQIQNIFDDQEYIYEFDIMLKEFLENIDLGALSGGGGDAEEDIVVEEEVVEEDAEPAVDPNVFVIDAVLLNEAGGAPPSPHNTSDPNFVNLMGNFTYVEFKSVEAMFEYVQSEGYGWDPALPSICFGFQVTENEDKNKYELEWLYRDQWPYMYTTMLRNDLNPTPISNANQLLGYSRAAYNGLNMMQVFAANSILQREYTPDSHIILFTIPYKIMEMRTSPLAVSVLIFNSLFILLSIVPILVYTSYSIAKEKEIGMRHLLHSNGLGQFIHYLSWLAHYTVINFFITLLYALSMKAVVYHDDQILLNFLVIFMGLQSIFGLIWAIQPFVNTAKMGVFVTGLFFFLSFFGSYAVSQKAPPIDMEVKKLMAIAPMTAIKLTFDVQAQFYYISWSMNFQNYDVVKGGWSLKLGLQIFVFNFLFWSAIGLIIDLVFNNMSYYYTNCLCLWKNAGAAGIPCLQRGVKFEKMREEEGLGKSEDFLSVNNGEQGLMQVTGLRERSIFSCRSKIIIPSYNFTVKKSKICCLIGNNSAQKSKILQMLAGDINCHGTVVIKDSDFFIRGKSPRLTDFLVIRSSTLVLDDELTAVEHLNLFAHLRGSQKHRNTRILCDKLLPEKSKIRNYSSSQRQFLQTLIALASDNSRIILLDEPTMGLDPRQRSELIKALWHFKKDRYIIMQSSDIELVNVLADSVAKVLSSGIQTVTAEDVDYEIGSYKLIVQVENGKPSDNLVRYLSKDVPELTLDYHSEQFTYYILPDINKSILHTKTKFMEKNKSILGLIDFEVVSMTAFEVAQRQIMLEESLQISSCDLVDFEDSVQDQSYGQEEVEDLSQNPFESNQSQQPPITGGRLLAADLLHSYNEEDIEEQQDKSKREEQELQTQQQQYQQQQQSPVVNAGFVFENSKIPSTPNGKQDRSFKLPSIDNRQEIEMSASQDPGLGPRRSLTQIRGQDRNGTPGSMRGTMLMSPPEVASAQGIEFDVVDVDVEDKSQNQIDESIDRTSENENDPEMRDFLDSIGQPFDKPNYNREMFYDFKKYKAKKSLCCTQCLFIWLRHWKESWNQKVQFLALIILPALFILVSYHTVRYYHHANVESRQVQPDWYPKGNKILVNERTQVGGIDTKKWVENLPQSSYFEPTFIDTDGDVNYFDFDQDVYDYCMANATEFPWSYGSYQFYEMNEEKHQYKFGSFVNVTSPYATTLYPQYMIESIMKTAMQDDDFEIKTRLTPFPVTQDTIITGNFLKSIDLEQINILLTMSDKVSFWSGKNLSVMCQLIFTWIVLNSFIITRVIKDRMSQRKHYQEHHRQSKLAYWIARFFHDVVYYIPISLMAVKMIQIFDDHMEFAPTCIMIQPLATLPFLYLISHLFTREVTGVITMFSYSLLVQLLIPYLVVASRLNSKTEVSGDRIFKLVKALPMNSVMSSIMFNTKMLGELSLYRENNTAGFGEFIVVDENDPINGPADVNWIMMHAIISWVVLILFVEWRLPFSFCGKIKTVSQEDNDEYFGELQLEQPEEDRSDDQQIDMSESSEVAQIEGEGENIRLQLNAKPKTDYNLAYQISGLTLQRGGRCCGISHKSRTETLLSNLSVQIQSGSKFAIVADGSQGKTSVLNTLISRRSAFRVAGLLKKQDGRGTPVYTCSQDSEVLYGELSLAQNLDFYVKLGSVHKLLVRQMVLSFGLKTRQHVLVKELNANERHIIQLILALAGSNRTVILDEPFTGLTSEHSLKLVKILRQKHDCTLIVTAKSKAEIELLQPSQIVTIRANKSENYLQSTDTLLNVGYLLSLRLRHSPSNEVVSVKENVSLQEIENLDLSYQPKLDSYSAEELTRFIQENFDIFDKLRYKKRRIVVQTVSKLLKKARMSPEINQEIAEMVHQDLELQTSSEELALKCQLIRSLFGVISALCKRFGEVHLEQRQDEYAVVRVVFNEACRPKNVQDSFTDEQDSLPVFSSVVKFVNSDQCVRFNAVSCHFLSAINNSLVSNTGNQKSLKKSQSSNTLPGQNNSSNGSKVVKIFRWSNKLGRMERANPAKMENNASSQILTSMLTQSIVNLRQ